MKSVKLHRHMHLFRPPTDRPTEEADNISSECGQFSRVIALFMRWGLGLEKETKTKNETARRSSVRFNNYCIQCTDFAAVWMQQKEPGVYQYLKE